MPATPALPSDRQLVDAARQGHDAAWQELMERHRSSLLAVLGARRRSARIAALDRVEALRAGLTSDGESEGDEAIRAFRPKAIAAVTGGAYGPGDAGGERPTDALLARAFGRLPEPWQTVLWHSHVEQLSSAEVSPLVGRATSDVADLVATAERGLVDAYALEVLAASEVDDETAAVISLLSGHVRGALPPHDQNRVERYLALRDDEPAGSGAALARDMTTLARSFPQMLPAAIAPGVTGLSVAEHRARLGTTDRSFGTATLFANRSDRARRAIVLGSVAAVVVALVGVAYLAGEPFVDQPVARPSGESPIGGPLLPEPTPGDGTGPAAPDPTVPETTELVLRPGAGDPVSTIEVIVGDGPRAVGLLTATGPSALSTVATVAAPVFAGGTGTIDLAISNTADDPIDASVELVLPRGIVLDGLASGNAVCSDPDDDSPFCNVSVDAGATLDLSLRVALESSVVGWLEVRGESLAEALEVPIVATRDLVHNSVGRGDAVVVGNTVMTCDDAAAAEIDISCNDVRAGSGGTLNRWDVPMAFSPSTFGDGTTNGSTATLDIPTDATVVHAELFWSGDLAVNGVSVEPGTENLVTVAAPDGDIVSVAAERLVFGEQDSTQYLGRADVTELVTTSGAGDWSVGDIAAVEAFGSYGGWALVVVFDHDSMPRRHRIVTDPFDWVAPEAGFSYEVEMPAPVVTGRAAQLDVIGFEGERGFTDERFVVGGALLGGDNPFDSTVTGPRDPAYDNNLGIDIDAYDLTIDTPNGLLGFAATSDDDGIRLAVLALTVDLAP